MGGRKCFKLSRACPFAKTTRNRTEPGAKAFARNFWPPVCRTLSLMMTGAGIMCCFTVMILIAVGALHGFPETRQRVYCNRLARIMRRAPPCGCLILLRNGSMKDRPDINDSIFGIRKALELINRASHATIIELAEAAVYWRSSLPDRLEVVSFAALWVYEKANRYTCIGLHCRDCICRLRDSASFDRHGLQGYRRQ